MEHAHEGRTRKKVLLLSRYDTLPAPSRYRFYQYLPYLAARGIDVTIAPLLDNTFVRLQYSLKRHPMLHMPRLYMRRFVDLLRARHFDLVWLEKEALPWIPAWMERTLGLGRIPYVVDYDDAVFVTYNEGRPAIVRFLLGHKIASLMQSAAMVIAGNQYLTKYARDAGATKVETVPSVVDLDRYPIRPREINNVFTMGWIGSPANSKHLRLIGDALASICREGGAKLEVVGGWQTDMQDGVIVEYAPWSEATEIEHLQRFDVGIMPLEDGPWESGKCGLKIIQYMAAGLPVVASPVGVNAELVQHGVNGFLAETNSDWVAALMTLRDDPTLRQRMGDMGRRKVMQKYCLQVTGPRMASLLAGVMEQTNEPV